MINVHKVITGAPGGTRTTQSVRLGEDWLFELRFQNTDGTPLDLTGGGAQFRLASAASMLLDLSIGSGITWIDQPNGIALLAVPPAMQAAILPASDFYTYEGRAVLADGTRSDQMVGAFQVMTSLFVAFPSGGGGALIFSTPVNSALIGAL